MRYRTPEEARRLRQANAVKVFVAGLIISPSHEAILPDRRRPAQRPLRNVMP